MHDYRRCARGVGLVILTFAEGSTYYRVDEFGNVYVPMSFVIDHGGYLGNPRPGERPVRGVHWQVAGQGASTFWTQHWTTETLTQEQIDEIEEAKTARSALIGIEEWSCGCVVDHEANRILDGCGIGHSTGDEWDKPRATGVTITVRPDYARLT